MGHDSEVAARASGEVASLGRRRVQVLQEDRPDDPEAVQHGARRRLRSRGSYPQRPRRESAARGERRSAHGSEEAQRTGALREPELPEPLSELHLSLADRARYEAGTAPRAADRVGRVTAWRLRGRVDVL